MNCIRSTATRRFFLAARAPAGFLAAAATLSAASGDAHAADVNPNAVYFISSQGTDEVMIYNEITGDFVTKVPASGPAASQIGFGGDMFLANAGGHDVLRYDGFTGAPKGIYVQPGAGG